MNKKAFTLLELLVVVLIIGILAVIALPQYKRAVDRSTAAQGISIIKSVWQSMESYYLTNNSFPTSFDQLDIEIPWTGNDGPQINVKDTRSNDKWSLQIYNGGQAKYILITIISGKYTGGGFAICKSNSVSTLPKGTILCREWRSSKYKISKDGLFCTELFNGKIQLLGDTAGIYTFEQ